MKYEPKSDTEDKPFHHQREYPLQVGVGILAHQQMRRRSITDILHKLGLSVDYTQILYIETQLAQAVLNYSNGHGTYIPTVLANGQFIYFAVDNSDFSEGTPDGKNTLHATAMVVFQRKTDYSPKLSLDHVNLCHQALYLMQNYCHVMFQVTHSQNVLSMAGWT